MKRAAQLNIGLATNSGGKFSPDAALEWLRVGAWAEDVVVIRSRVAQSDTEPTLVVELSTPLSQRMLDSLSIILSQDCIAQLYPDGHGELVGPRAAAWGAFDPARFIQYEA